MSFVSNKKAKVFSVSRRFPVNAWVRQPHAFCRTKLFRVCEGLYGRAHCRVLPAIFAFKALLFLPALLFFFGRASSLPFLLARLLLFPSSLPSCAVTRPSLLRDFQEGRLKRFYRAATEPSLAGFPPFVASSSGRISFSGALAGTISRNRGNKFLCIGAAPW
jgi:hypothetical protein